MGEPSSSSSIAEKTNTTAETESAQSERPTTSTKKTGEGDTILSRVAKQLEDSGSVARKPYQQPSQQQQQSKHALSKTPSKRAGPSYFVNRRADLSASSLESTESLRKVPTRSKASGSTRKLPSTRRVPTSVNIKSSPSGESTSSDEEQEKAATTPGRGGGGDVEAPEAFENEPTDAAAKEELLRGNDNSNSGEHHHHHYHLSLKTLLTTKETWVVAFLVLGLVAVLVLINIKGSIPKINPTDSSETTTEESGEPTSVYEQTQQQPPDSDLFN